MFQTTTLSIFKFSFGNFQIYEINETDYEKEPFSSTLVMYKDRVQITYPNFQITNVQILDDDIIEVELVNDNSMYIYKKVNMLKHSDETVPLNESMVVKSYEDMFDLTALEEYERCVQNSFCFSEKIIIPKA